MVGDEPTTPYLHETTNRLGPSGVRLWCGVWRPTRDGLSGAPVRGVVIISHGFGEHLGRYEHVIRALTGAGYIVVGHDHRGHGRSDGPRTDIVDFDDYVRDVAVDRLAAREEVARAGLPETTRPFLLGHSMGGLIAIRYVLCLSDQSDLAGLMLSSPALQLYPDLPDPLVRVAGLLAKIAPQLYVAEPRPTVLSRDPMVVRDFEADPYTNKRGTRLRMAHRMIAAGKDARRQLHRLTLPMLVMYGEADRLVNPAGAKLLAQRAASPDLTEKAWPGLRHEIFNEPEGPAVIACLLDWLDAHTEPAHLVPAVTESVRAETTERSLEG